MATIDASIPLGIRPVQIESPVNQLAKVLQVRGLQQEGDMNRLRMDEYQRGITEQNALSGLYQTALKPDGTIDRNALYTGAAQRGLGHKIPGLQKQFLEHDEKTAKIGQDRAQTGKYEADTQKIQLETTIQKISLGAQILSTAKDQASYDAARATAQAQGLDVSRMPPQFDPAFVQGKLQESMTIKEQLEQKWKQLGHDLDVTKAQETGRHNKASEGLTARGQNMTDARSREATSASMTKPFEVTGPDGTPILVQQDKQGNIRPVQGFAPKSGGKTMTEGQAKANLFGSRMKESDRILTELEGKYSPLAVNSKMAAEKMPGLGGVAGAVGNAMLSSEGQMAEQAQRDFVNAVLRRESGAVISEPEFANAQKQYFPQPNDSKAVLEQKRRNRQMAIQGLSAEVPGGFRLGGQQGGGASGGWGIQKVN